MRSGIHSGGSAVKPANKESIEIPTKREIYVVPEKQTPSEGEMELTAGPTIEDLLGKIAKAIWSLGFFVFAGLALNAEWIWPDALYLILLIGLVGAAVMVLLIGISSFWFFYDRRRHKKKAV